MESTACSPNVRQPAGVSCACRLGALHLACSKYIKDASWSDVGDSCNSDEGVSDVEGASSIIGTSEFCIPGDESASSIICIFFSL